MWGLEGGGGIRLMTECMCVVWEEGGGGGWSHV